MQGLMEKLDKAPLPVGRSAVGPGVVTSGSVQLAVSLLSRHEPQQKGFLTLTRPDLPRTICSEELVRFIITQVDGDY